MPTAVSADKDWYLRQSLAQRLPNHCPIAANDKCPRYFVSQKLASSAGATTFDLATNLIDRLQSKWESSDVFCSIDLSVGIHLTNDGSLRGVDGFCPEITARIFKLYCSDVRPFPDEDAHSQNDKALTEQNIDKSDLRWKWMIVEPKHYCECHEFSVYGSQEKSGIQKAKARKGTLSPKLRFKVFSRDGYRCAYCGATGADSALQVDHRISVSDGGTDAFENLVTACEKCNSGKGAKSVISSHSVA